MSNRVVFQAHLYLHKTRLLSRNWRKYWVEVCENGYLFWYKVKTKLTEDGNSKPYYVIKGFINLHEVGSSNIHLSSEIFELKNFNAVPIHKSFCVGRQVLHYGTCMVLKRSKKQSSSSIGSALDSYIPIACPTMQSFIDLVKCLKRIGVIIGRISHLTDPSPNSRLAGPFAYRSLSQSVSCIARSSARLSVRVVQNGPHRLRSFSRKKVQFNRRSIFQRPNHVPKVFQCEAASQLPDINSTAAPPVTIEVEKFKRRSVMFATNVEVHEPKEDSVSRDTQVGNYRDDSDIESIGVTPLATVFPSPPPTDNEDDNVKRKLEARNSTTTTTTNDDGLIEVLN